MFTLVLFPDRYFLFLFGDVEKRVWWISIGRFVLLTPRFWELLIGVSNYKGHPLNDVPLSHAQNNYKGHPLNNVPLWRVHSTSAHAAKEHR